MDWYYLWAMLLLIANGLSWLSNLVLVPGNWLILGLTLFFVWFFPPTPARGISWATLGIALGMAAAGEAVEFLAGAWGAARTGASRRAMALALLGTLVGSVLGTGAGIPIPILGPVFGALLGGVLGAFAGAYIGETWKGSTAEESYKAGAGAAVGRLLGTGGKLFLGAIMVVLITVDSLF